VALDRAEREPEPLGDLLMREVIVACAATGTKDKKWLDIPTGNYAQDSDGGELASGAYLDVPNWDSYAYDNQTKINIIYNG
jgi:hypothetical protein